jgi:hypothetical protein
MKLATLTAYHPQTNGQTKHVNQELKGYLQNFTNQCQDNWDELLLLGGFNHNTHQHDRLLSWLTLVGILAWALSLSSQG